MPGECTIERVAVENKIRRLGAQITMPSIRAEFRVCDERIKEMVENSIDPHHKHRKVDAKPKIRGDQLVNPPPWGGGKRVFRDFFLIM